MIFSNEEELIDTISEGLLYMAYLVIIFDSILAVLLETARAIGFQLQTFLMSMISNYLIAIPLVYYFVFYTNLNILGIWLGFSAGLILSGILMIILLITKDWKLIIETSNLTKDI